MKTGKSAERDGALHGETFHFVVFVPHRDTEKPWYEYKRELFRKGFTGAYALPGVVPLALIDVPLPRGPLLDLGREMRERIAENPNEGKISGSHLDTLRIPELRLSFLGLALDLPPLDFSRIARRSFEKTLLSAALIEGVLLEGALQEGALNKGAFREAASGKVPRGNSPPSPPRLSFRAGALANMALRQRDSFYEWKIGKLVWLPRRKNKG